MQARILGLASCLAVSCLQGVSWLLLPRCCPQRLPFSSLAAHLPCPGQTPLPPWSTLGHSGPTPPGVHARRPLCAQAGVLETSLCLRRAFGVGLLWRKK